MRSFIRTFLTTGICFGFLMGIFYVYEKGMVWGIRAGICSGFLFGLVMAVFARSQENKALTSPPLLSDERLLREGSAHHVLRTKGLIGRLYLTDKRLLFEAFPSNKEVHEVSIPVHEISEAFAIKSYGFVRNKVRVANTDGSTETFLTDDVNGWIEEINERRTYYLDEPRSDEMRLFP